MKTRQLSRANKTVNHPLDVVNTVIEATSAELMATSNHLVEVFITSL